MVGTYVPPDIDDNAVDSVFPLLPGVIKFVEKARDSQDLAGELRTLEAMKSGVTKYYLQEDSPEKPYYPLALFVLIAFYVGDILWRSKSHTPLPQNLVLPAKSAAIELVILMSPIRRKIGIERLVTPARCYHEYQSYRIFIKECDKWFPGAPLPQDISEALPASPTVNIISDEVEDTTSICQVMANSQDNVNSEVASSTSRVEGVPELLEIIVHK